MSHPPSAFGNRRSTYSSRRKPSLRKARSLRISIAKAVHTTMLSILKAPGAAQVHHAKATSQCFWHPGAGLLVWCCEENGVNAVVGKQLPAEWMDGECALRCEAAQSRVLGRK